MENRKIIFPFYVLLIAAGVGVLWPLPFLLFPNLGGSKFEALITAILAYGAGLLVHSFYPPGKRLTYPKYILNSAILGLVAIVVAMMVLAFLCLFLHANPVCSREGGVMAFGFLYYFFFLFIASVVYSFVK